MKECLDRFIKPQMEYYWHLYCSSPKWDGLQPLAGKTVVVYAEQGFGDIIHFSRYLIPLKARGARVIFHCPKELHRLFEQFHVELLDKTDPDIPQHDYHIPSLSLPFLLGEFEVPTPYLSVDESIHVPTGPGLKIGIAWEGNPCNPIGEKRNCPLRHFKPFVEAGHRLFMAQHAVVTPDLVVECDDLDIYGVEIKDFYDTAKLLNSMDCVVTVDTAVLHLAGAMGKKAFGMLCVGHDARWSVNQWYDNVILVKQNQPGDWGSVVKSVLGML